MNRKINPKLASALLVMFSIGLPAYLLKDNDWSKFELTGYLLIVPIIYAFFVSLMCLMILKVKGPEVTSEETDHRINAFRLKARPYVDKLVYVLLSAVLIYMAYLSLVLWLKA